MSVLFIGGVSRRLYIFFGLEHLCVCVSMSVVGCWLLVVGSPMGRYGALSYPIATALNLTMTMNMIQEKLQVELD